MRHLRSAPLRFGASSAISLLLGGCGLFGYVAKDDGPGEPGQGPDTGAGDNGSGDNGSGDNGSGDNGSGDNGSGDNGSGDNGGNGGNGGKGGNGGSDSVDPPLGASSGGDGGSDSPTPTAVSWGGVDSRLLAPTGSSSGHRVPFLLVISGTEGADAMMNNMKQVTGYAHISDAIVVVLDGQSVNGAEAATVVDEVRDAYDVDNDRTWLLSESAGTTPGLSVGLNLRQSYFAAYWVNDVNTRDTPAETAEALGFAPWGNAGPGGDTADAEAIVDGMRAAGYQLPDDAPYSGPGSTSHGSSAQFLEAVSFFSDKARE